MSTYRCEECGQVYTSQLAALECGEMDREEDQARKTGRAYHTNRG